MNVFGDIKLKGVDKNGEEKVFSLPDLGKEIVLYFYPKDNTPYCTQEAKDFRDNLNKLASKATVVGVSPDSVESHKQFLKENSLNFPLLSDPENQLAKRLGVGSEKIANGKKYMSVDRSTFIIKDGLITKAWKNVNVPGHVEKVIESL